MTARRVTARRGPQADLFGGPGWPEGFIYQSETLSAADEAAIVARLGQVDFAPFRFRGVDARRLVASFGWRYDFAGGRLERAPAIPDWALEARRRAADLAGRAAEEFEQLMINRYPAGAPIGWHRDRRAFGVVAAISLSAPCRLRFRRQAPEGWARAEALVEPRSAYVLAGPARSLWEHSIPPAPSLRFSLTFRTLMVL